MARNLWFLFPLARSLATRNKLFFVFLAGEDWKATWKNRLEKAGQAWTKKWTEHQTYDDYWKHGCICEDYDRIKIPILAIGGWHDMYSNAVFRMVEKMPNCR